MHSSTPSLLRNQIIDSSRSVRYGKANACCVAQVSGECESTRSGYTLELLARWRQRLLCCTTGSQSLIADAWRDFDENSRLRHSSFRVLVVEVVEEFAMFTGLPIYSVSRGKQYLIVLNNLRHTSLF
jgi:hypothetical protein